jgi:ankyrin repeat protein
MFEDINNGNIEGVKLAIANGSDVNVKDELGSTPLDGAVYDGHKEIAELLIANGANANAKDEDGATPLHLAADTGHKDIVELLISKGADVNAKDEDETTPLYTATPPTQPEAVFDCSLNKEFSFLFSFQFCTRLAAVFS